MLIYIGFCELAVPIVPWFCPHSPVVKLDSKSLFATIALYAYRSHLETYLQVSSFLNAVFSYKVGEVSEAIRNVFYSFCGLLRVKGFLAIWDKQWNSQLVSFVPFCLFFFFCSTSLIIPDNNSNSWFCETNMEGDS